MPRYVVRLCYVKGCDDNVLVLFTLACGAGAAASPHPDCVARGGSGGWEVEGGGHAATGGTDHHFAPQCRSLIVI